MSAELPRPARRRVPRPAEQVSVLVRDKAAEAHGHGNMLYFDGAMGVAGAVVLLVIAAIALPRKRAQSVSS